jgi:hypothetical protein
MLVRLVGVVLLVTFCAFYAYLPGEYDALAVPLSAVAQAIAVLASLFIAPIGALWLLHQMRARASARRGHDRPSDRPYRRATLVATMVVAVAASLVAWGSGGRVFGAMVLGLAAFGLARLSPLLTDIARPVPRPRPETTTVPSSPSAEAGHLPLYLAVAPIVALLLQALLAEPVASFSRTRAIANSAALIDDIERHRATYGSYPESLSGTWPDYKVAIVGIAQFHYARRGDAYNLHFEQPVPQLRTPGTREYVVYNPSGQHVMLSHAVWHLSRPPSSLDQGQGWYASHDAGSPGWKRFLFD